MMIGPVPTSVPQIILLANWLAEGKFKQKWIQLKSTKVFWVIIAFFLVDVVGMLYTSSVSEGVDDLRIKMPIFFLSLIIFSTKALSEKELRGVLYMFLLGSFVNVAWCYLYNFVLHENEVARDASRFMSHIRLGLYLNMAIAVSVYFFFMHKTKGLKILFALLAALFLFAMYKLGLASGLINFFILLFFALCYIILKQKLTIRLILIALIITGVWCVAAYIKNIYTAQFVPLKSEVNEIKKLSLNKRPYTHYNAQLQKENGVFVYLNIQSEELLWSWNKRCPDDTFSYHPALNLRRYEVLIRYLSSLGLTKDSLGVSALTESDIKNIKQNITNYKFADWSYLHKRVYELTFEYEEFINGQNINGHSLTMRPYFWKAAWHIITKNPLIGVGTGDIQKEMNIAYQEIKSPLNAEWHKRPHNQFLAITVAFGIIGLLVFLVSLIAPYFMLRKHLNVLYKPFLALVLVSFILEDTLESQPGMTFYAVFSVLFLSEAWFKSKTQHNPAD